MLRRSFFSVINAELDYPRYKRGQVMGGNYSNQKKRMKMHKRYNKYMNSDPSKANDNPEMVMATAGAINAITGGEDWSNGADGWHGKDFFLDDTPSGSIPSWARTADNCWKDHKEYMRKGFIWDPNAIIKKALPNYFKERLVNGKAGYVGVAYYGGNVFTKSK